MLAQKSDLPKAMHLFEASSANLPCESTAMALVCKSRYSVATMWSDRVVNILDSGGTKWEERCALDRMKSSAPQIETRVNFLRQ